MAALDVVILLIAAFGFAYFRSPAFVWILAMTVLLVLITSFGHLNFLFLSLSWLIFLTAAAFTLFTQLRQKYITEPLIQILQERMPPISTTEREAIEAGHVWWEKDLFCGQPHWKKFLSIPPPKLSAEEQDFLDQEVETLCGMLDDWRIVNVDKDLSPAVWDYLKKERFLGMVIPKEYGGRGFSALAHSSVVVKIATRSVSAAVNTMVPNSLGPAELLLHYGTPEQKDYYLPRLARGEEIPCFALTGPEAGSDAGSISDAGIVCRGEYEGKEVLGIRLSWDKRYITLAPIATVLGLAFRLYDPENYLGKEKDLGITLCLVPTNHLGVEIGDRHLPLHLAFMNGPTRGKDVFIPIDWIIGGVNKAGQGWKMLMECLSIGRAISLPALSAACGQLAFRATGAYSRVRRQFNTSIAHFEGVEEALGNIAGLTYLNEACRIMTAGAVDLKIRPAIASAIAKYHMTEMARKIIANAMDVHAGQSIQVGPRNILAHAHMAVPVSITVEGANILTRNLIVFGQGAIRCHPYILQEIELLSSPENPEKVRKLDRILLSHVGYLMCNVSRTLWSGLTGGRFLSTPVEGPMAYYYRQLTRMSSALALLSDVCMMLLGGTLKRKERISARLGDILSQLYLASAVLKYYQDHGQPTSDNPYVIWSIETCLHHIQMTCDDLLNNFPVKGLGKILLWIIFPFGISYRKPKDRLYHKIVTLMLSPSPLRDRLSRLCYVGKNMQEPLQRLDVALSQVQKIDPIWKKFQTAVRKGTVPRQGSFEERTQSALKTGVLTQDEANSLFDFEALYKEVIKVNEFSFDLNTIVT